VKDKIATVKAFKEEESCKVFVSSKSGAFGLNLQEACHHMAFYETPDDPLTRNQAEIRIRRPGQTKTTYYYDLIIEGSVDQRIIRSLQQGKKLFDSLVEGKKL